MKMTKEEFENRDWKEEEYGLWEENLDCYMDSLTKKELIKLKKDSLMDQAKQRIERILDKDRGRVCLNCGEPIPKR